jgi:uroporphyrinogen-III synthase
MKTETVVLKIEKRVNDANELEPNLYTVIENDVILFTTHNAVYALQAVLNRS